VKQIIYSSQYVPPEWIEAHGLRPERILPEAVTTNCTVSRLEGLCPYVRAFMNNILTNRRDCGVIITTACDQMRRGFELLGDRGQCVCFLMNVPKTWQSIAAKDLFRDEIRRLGRFMVGLGGKEPSPEFLAAIMLKYNAARHVLRASRTRLPAKEFSLAIAAFDYEGLNAPRKATGSNRKTSGIPVMIIGGPLMKDDYGLFDIIETLGGRVELDGTETGERGICPPFDEERIHNDPITELAEAYFLGIQDPSRRPNTRFYNWLEDEIKTRDIRAIILRRYLWCDLWHSELYRIKQVTGLPVLEIDVDGEEEPLPERTKQRISAFMEVVTCSTNRGK
jgi:benzoyl-CoA reductase/2-hydroxyglutaryl-CoA dehydratase subunit BcrC/BadD/HgdB